MVVLAKKVPPQPIWLHHRSFFVTPCVQYWMEGKHKTNFSDPQLIVKLSITRAPGSGCHAQYLVTLWFSLDANRSIEDSQNFPQCPIIEHPRCLISFHIIYPWTMSCTQPRLMIHGKLPYFPSYLITYNRLHRSLSVHTCQSSGTVCHDFYMTTLLICTQRLQSEKNGL